MTIASALTALNQDIQNARTTITTKGGTVTADGGSSQLATDIATIPTGGMIDSLTITPTTSQQTITASGGTDGYSPITVNAVTSAIDANIQASNIKSGVSILGVSGSVTELNGETRTEQLNSTSGNTYTPTTGKNAITSITVTPKNYARTVAPQTTQSVWAVPSGYSGHGNITVSPVTPAIDANIQASNIKSGVTILGVTGNYAGGGSKYGCTIENLLGDVDANGVLQMPADTSGDIVFTGVKDLADYGLYYKYSYNTNLNHGVSFPDLETVSGISACNYAFFRTGVSSISLPKLKTVSGTDGMRYCFGYIYATSISLPELETVSGNGAMRNFASNCSNLTSISLPKLKTVTGSYAIAHLVYYTKITTFSLPELTTANNGNALYSICSSCSLLETAYFTKLSDISGQTTFAYSFIGCPVLTDVYFNALTTTSFGSYVNQFANMFNATSMSTSGNCTIHFPSNLSSTISGLTGYPNFGATAGRLTLAFDLPATS